MAKKRKSKKLTPQEKEKRQQKSEITTTLKNVGFSKLQYIDGKEIVFDGRTSEMDDIFVYENIILIVEYTVGSPGSHLKNKKIFYDKVNSNKRKFIDFLLTEEKLKSFKNYYETNIEGKYSKNELKIKILYCSKQSIDTEHRNLVDDVIFFDYHIVKYFLSLTKVIKRTAKYEFFDFLKIPFNTVGDNIKSSSSEASLDPFVAHIVPEEKSSFKEGYKIVSFYMDAEALLKRAYVLRQNGWQNLENIGHYQRMFVSPKMGSLRRYLATKNRVFINNVISSIKTDKIELFDNHGKRLDLDDDGQFIGEDSTKITPATIKIKDERNIIGIIDGQHRTFAYHEGDDQYENKIANLRKRQNLLVTGILFPKSESDQKRLKFEADLFLEINSNQSNAASQLKQEIELIINPFSNIAIAKRILQGLNKSGPLSDLIEVYWYEKGKIKTASIVSYGLRPLIKIDDTRAKDSIFVIWKNSEKDKLKGKGEKDYQLLDDYVDFSVEKIRDLLIAFKSNLTLDQWKTFSPSNSKSVLTVTFVNGILNVLRLLIQNGKVTSAEKYKDKLKGLDIFNFKKYKSSQYRKMGEDIYTKYF